MAGRPKRRARLSAGTQYSRAKKARENAGRPLDTRSHPVLYGGLDNLQTVLNDLEAGIMLLAPLMEYSQRSEEGLMSLYEAVERLRSTGVSLPWGYTEDYEGRTILHSYYKKPWSP